MPVDWREGRKPITPHQLGGGLGSAEAETEAFLSRGRPLHDASPPRVLFDANQASSQHKRQKRTDQLTKCESRTPKPVRGLTRPGGVVVSGLEVSEGPAAAVRAAAATAAAAAVAMATGSMSPIGAPERLERPETPALVPVGATRLDKPIRPRNRDGTGSGRVGPRQTTDGTGRGEGAEDARAAAAMDCVQDQVGCTRSPVAPSKLPQPGRTNTRQLNEHVIKPEGTHQPGLGTDDPISRLLYGLCSHSVSFKAMTDWYLHFPTTQ
ncbi:unnamed protein product [Protopolystoma xenopodis]|uniref:Uncharacterized protein n=1 Tax=Protopolystoma xenopodis TaxID=117903 RepID=A0A3S5BTJ5_9PLAT|nr:unnamed protein product [Protopolystoma xenopodis]